MKKYKRLDGNRFVTSPFKLSPKAREQLIHIWAYTQETWGEAQADQYIQGLYQALTELHANKILWRPLSDPKFAGVYFFRYKKHVIFFKLLASNAVGILTLLHERSDLPMRLLNDLNENTQNPF